jgi:hypothetical protein
MSSWLSRVGCRYDLGSASIAEWVEPTSPLFERTRLDWGMTKVHWARIARATRLSEDEVEALDGRRRFPGQGRYWFALDLCAHSPWTGCDVYGYRFRWAWCPQCLMNGFALTGQDYIRFCWVFASVSYCHEHRLPLTASCSECHSGAPPVHLPDRTRTHLVCGNCHAQLKLQKVAEDRVPRLSQSAIDLQIQFEQDLTACLRGDRPSERWCGRASGRQFTTLVRDLAYVLCEGRSYLRPSPIKMIQPAWEELRAPDVPSFRYKLCALSPFWRARVLGAVISAMGSSDLCTTFALDLRDAPSLGFRHRRKLRPSLEWLLSWAVIEPSILISWARKWPAGPRARLHAAFVAAGVIKSDAPAATSGQRFKSSLPW